MACCKKAKKLQELQKKRKLQLESITKREKNDTKMRDLVKDVDWQTLRKNLVGTWIEQPEWACGQLSKYLGNTSEAVDKKLRIVMNYLTGTGFRTGRIKHTCIQNLRTQISMEMKKRKAKGE